MESSQVDTARAQEDWGRGSGVPCSDTRYSDVFCRWIKIWAGLSWERRELDSKASERTASQSYSGGKLERSEIT